MERGLVQNLFSENATDFEFRREGITYWLSLGPGLWALYEGPNSSKFSLAMK